MTPGNLRRPFTALRRRPFTALRRPFTALRRPFTALRRPFTARVAIVVLTVGSLGTAFVLTALWFAGASGRGRLEPAAEALGLLAGISGVVAERRAATAERRTQALDAVREELHADAAVLAGAPFRPQDADHPVRQVYRRLHLTAVDAALLSAVLSPSRDEELTRMLRAWRNQVEVFNHQLSLAEVLAFTSGSDQVAAVLQDLHEGLHAPDGPLVTLRERLAALLDVLEPGRRAG